ncbi:MAG: hypothetical protein PHI89_08475 [Thiovulaceae bacterium]|jgi:hypothetical protein|nr:hypothetical protein [Sulfurimonadaceae bacterium]
MQTLKVRKNFLLDSETIEKATLILKHKHKNLTEALELYFQAIVKNPTILDTIEQSATKRSGSFIGLLDAKVGNLDFKEMKKEKYEDLS